MSAHDPSNGPPRTGGNEPVIELQTALRLCRQLQDEVRGQWWRLVAVRRLRRLQPTDAATRHLQAISRLRGGPPGGQDHCRHQPAQRPAEAHWPGAKAIFARLDSDIALDFLERYPTPQAAQRLGEARLAGFLRRHGYSGRRTQPSCFTGCGPPRSQSTSSIPRSWPTPIRIQVRLLRSLLGTLADLDRALAAALGKHPKATVLQPLPRIGQINLAQVLAEVGPILDRASDLSHAAAEGGATPVTK